MPPKSNRLLLIAGYLSLAIAIFQAIISCVPTWSLYFGAPAEMVENRWLLLLLGEIAAGFFAIFGLYGLSGAGKIRRLFLLRTGLIVISSIYLLRGLMVVYELLIISHLISSPEAVTTQAVISSLVSLFIGLNYAIGTIGSWRYLKP